MQAYAAMGDRAAALRHFERLAQQLQDEIGVSPTNETVALYRTLRCDTGSLLPLRKASPSGRTSYDRLIIIRRQLLSLSRELGRMVRESRRPEGY